MKKLIAVASMTLLLVACGGASDAVDTTEPGADTTVAEQSSTTSAQETTTTTESATTTAAAETTTTAATGEAAGGALDALFSKVQTSEELTSARIEGLMEMVGVEGDTGVVDVTLPFSSTFDLVSGDTAIAMDMSGFGGALGSSDDPEAALAAAMLGEIEIRQIGDRAYMKMPFLTSMLGTEAEWVSMPAEEAGAFSTDMGLQTDPYEMLEDYRDANAQVEDLGVEAVNGVDATHYHVVVDTEAWLATLSAEERAELEADGPVPLTQFPMDLWISEDGFVVRMVMEIDGSAVETTATDESFERMTLTYDVFDINQPVEITAPEDFVDISELGGFGLDETG